MATMIETSDHGTHSCERTAPSRFKVRDSGRFGAISASEQAQGLSMNALVVDIKRQIPASDLQDILRLVVGSHLKNREYLVTASSQRQRCAELTPRPPARVRQMKHQEHMHYLQRVSTEGSPPPITRATAKKSWNLWLALRRAAGQSFPVPCAGTGPGGVMFYSWDSEEHHLEAEIFPNCDTEFFYRNRQTGSFWGEDYCGGTIPKCVLDVLKLFV